MAVHKPSAAHSKAEWGPSERLHDREDEYGKPSRPGARAVGRRRTTAMLAGSRRPYAGSRSATVKGGMPDLCCAECRTLAEEGAHGWGAA
jgi:hypothetical protein